MLWKWSFPTSYLRRERGREMSPVQFQRDKNWTNYTKHYKVDAPYTCWKEKVECALWNHRTMSCKCCVTWQHCTEYCECCGCRYYYITERFWFVLYLAMKLSWACVAVGWAGWSTSNCWWKVELPWRTGTHLVHLCLLSIGIHSWKSTQPHCCWI